MVSRRLRVSNAGMASRCSPQAARILGKIRPDPKGRGVRKSQVRNLGDAPMSTQDVIRDTVKKNRVVLYMKGTPQFPQCGFSMRAVQILKACGVEDFVAVDVLQDPEIRQGIKDYANWPTIPQLYVDGEFVGGSDILTEMYQAGELQPLLQPKTAG
jgi:monothiol glutaredoxin